MNKPADGTVTLPGLESVPTALTPPATPAVPTRLRVKPVDRSQLSWQMLDVERLIEPEHNPFDLLRRKSGFASAPFGHLPKTI